MEKGAPMTRSVDDRLITAAEKTALKRANLKGGKDQKHELPEMSTKPQTDIEPGDDQEKELSAAELAVLQIGQLPQALNPIQRAHGMTHAIDPELGI